MLLLNRKVPDFSFQATGGLETTLSQLAGKKIVLYFYPKDNTPGCTTEGQDFTTAHSEFLSHDTLVFGVSKDTLASHEKFKAKFRFPFELISDTEAKLCKIFDVIKPKNLYGKQYIGIERSTFLLDAEGVLRQEWRKVRIKGHVASILETIHALDE